MESGDGSHGQAGEDRGDEPGQRPMMSREGDGRFSVRWFDADRTDRSMSFDEALGSEPTGRHLLWIDVSGDLGDEEAAALAERFSLDGGTRRELLQPAEQPRLALHGEYVHLRLAVEPDPAHPEDAPWLDIVAAPNVVISRHHTPIRFLAGMDERIKSDTTVGLLDSGTFAAGMLDAAVTTYFRAVDAMEDEVDRLDARSLRGPSGNELLDELVRLRRRIARLRRLLTEHRELFAGLAAADFAHEADSDDTMDTAALFQAVAGRFESAIGAVEDSREVLLGSFDVFMTRTAQRTNEIMKVLALATVLLLPGSLIAGLLGMNVDVPLAKDDPRIFWAVVAVVLALALAILGVAWRRRWL